MKKLTVKLTTLLAIFGTSVITTKAQTTQIEPLRVVTSAVPFLRISPDARSGGMGELGVATTPDASSHFWNLAKNPFNTNQGGVVLTYTPWLKDIVNDVFLASIAGYYKLDDDQAISGSLRYFSLGSIQFTDDNGNPYNSFNPKEFGVDFGYSRKLSKKLGLGVALRYINSNLAGSAVGNFKAGTAIAGDIALYGTSGKADGSGLSYGLVLSNLGSRISYTNDATQKDYIPANIGIGAMYTKVIDESNKITFGIDLNKLLVPTPPAADDTTGIANYRKTGVVSSWFKSFGDAPGGFSEEMKEVSASLGAEYWYSDQFAFRAGYFYEGPQKGNRQYFTLGAGLKYNNFGLNFSYLLPSGNGTSRNPLSNTLRFSLLFDFGGNTSGKTK